jgi:aryl-alcohol dehydrogenase-like predicted oxidoreductase
MAAVLHDLPPSRKRELVLCTGAYNFIWWRQNVRRALEKRLRQIGVERIDIFLFLGVMRPEQMPERVLDDLRRLRDEGKVKAIGVSTHDRAFAGRLAAEGLVDVLMIRYNAAHRGAERDVFPHLAAHEPGVIGYTATRWGFLTRPTAGWPAGERLPDAGMAYRFVLGSPHVDVVLTAPRNRQQLVENLRAVRQGPLSEDEMALMRRFGDAVHRNRKWFM